MRMRSLLASVLAFGLMGLQAGLACAQPVIRTFTVQPVPALVPGTELVFKVNGSPGGQVSLKLAGSASTVPLAEGQPGAYQGAYTLNNRDQVTHSSAVQATLRLGDQETRANLGQPLLTASAQKAAGALAKPAGAITYLDTRVTGPYAGGSEIAFTLKGAPGGQASLAVTGSDARIPLAETQPGEYTGQYTLRTRDTITARSTVNATLVANGSTSRASKALSADAWQAPVVAPMASTFPAPGTGPAVASHQTCDTCGVVQNIQVVDVKGQPGYVGAIAGGVAGAVLGSQVGKGDGRTVAQVLGAVGGAYAGREVEKRVKSEKHHDVTVRLYNGQVQTISHNQDPNLRVGGQVKIVGGVVVAND
jgi:outer membrane lipoprotein SlyB